MGINFLHPILLPLLPLSLAAVIFVSGRFLPKGFKRGLFTAVRCLVVTLLALALAGMTIVNHADITSNIFLIDVSASMYGTEETVSDFLRAARDGRGDKDSTAAVSFGGNAVVEAMPSLTDMPYIAENLTGKDYTNIAEGMRMARSIIPENTRKHIVLISDGLENVGDALTQARMLGEQGVTISVVPVESGLVREAQLTAIKTPKSIKKDARYDIEVTGHALAATNARLLVYKNNGLVADEQVTMRAGQNTFVFSDTADKSGGVIYRAEIIPEEDTFPQNNAVYGYSAVEGAPGLLVVDSGGSAQQILRILEGAGVNAERVTPQAAPTELSVLTQYDAVILANVPITVLPEQFPALLEGYVKNTGGGLLVTGGDESFALGDYKDTPLETALPVNMELKDKEKAPNLGMIVVVDRSGSMGVGPYGVSKLELAKEAVIRSLETMNDKDSLGVVAFDDGYHWASGFQLIGGNRGQIETNVANIQLGGGTSILPGLNAAYEAISAADTKLKHIVLLTDGQAEQYGYDNLLEKMNNEGITLSTVAVGSDSDTRLLKRLADNAGGRYYYSDEFSDLPKIFARETQMAGKTFLNNETFTPVVVNGGQIMAGVNAMPSLDGYLSTTAKDRADLVLMSGKEEPVLATWQFGLGRSAAWTSDMNGMWSAGWLASDEGVAIFRNTVSWVMRRQMPVNVSLTARLDGEDTALNASIPDVQDITRVTAAVTAPDLSERIVDFKATAPGEYTAILEDVNSEGAYVVALEIETAAGAQLLTTGVSIPYSGEYDIRNIGKGENLLRRIASAAGGGVLTSPEDVYTAAVAAAQGQTDISNPLLAAALALFLLDIFLRRFPFAANGLEALCAKAEAQLHRKKETPVFTKQPPGRPERAAPEPLTGTPGKQTPPKEENTPAGQSATSGALVSRKKKRNDRRG